MSATRSTYSTQEGSGSLPVPSDVVSAPSSQNPGIEGPMTLQWDLEGTRRHLLPPRTLLYKISSSLYHFRSHFCLLLGEIVWRKAAPNLNRSSTMNTASQPVDCRVKRNGSSIHANAKWFIWSVSWPTAAKRNLGTWAKICFGVLQAPKKTLHTWAVYKPLDFLASENSRCYTTSEPSSWAPPVRGDLQYEGLDRTRNPLRTQLWSSYYETPAYSWSSMRPI